MSETPGFTFEVNAPDSDAAIRKKQVQDDLSGPGGVSMMAYINGYGPGVKIQPEHGTERGDIQALDGGQNAA